jgi:fibronectin-binding autotransporter adhesin
MRRIILLFAGLLFSIYSMGQLKTWTGANASNPHDWNDADNWSPAGVPASTDSVLIPDLGSSGTYPVIGVTDTCYHVQLDQNATFTIPYSLVLQVDAGFTSSTGSANSVSVSGTLRFAGSGGSCTGNLEITGSGSVDVATTRTLDVDGNLTDHANFTNSGIINISASSSLRVNGTFTAYGTSEVHVSTTGTGGLFVIGGYLTWDSSNGLDLQNDGILRFSGMTSGTFTRNVTDTAVISGTGTVEVESGFYLYIQGLLTVNTTFHNSGQIYLYQSTVMTVNGSYTGDGSAAVGAGINGYNSMFITTGPFSWNSTGHVNLNYGAVFRFGGTGTGIVISDSITVDGWGSIDVAGSRTLNLNGTITGNTGFTNSGIVNIRASANLTVNGTFTAYGTSEVHVSTTGTGGLFVIRGNLTWDSSYNLDLQNDGKLRFSGTTSGTFTRNVTDTAVISGMGTVEVESGFNLFIQGLLTVNTAIHNSGQIFLYQSTVMTLNGSYTGGGSAAVSAGINGYNSIFITTGHFSWNSTGHVNLNYGAVFRFGGTGAGITISGILTADGWGTIDVPGSRTLNVTGTLTDNADFTNSGIVNISASANLTVNGTFTAYGTSEVHVSTTGTGGLFVIGGNLTWDSSNDLDLQNDGILRFSGIANGTFTRNVTDTAVISGSGTVEAESGFNLYIQGLLTVNTAFHNSGQLYLYQSSVMTVNGTYTGDGSAAVSAGINGYNSIFITTGPFSWNSTGHVNLNYGAVFRFGGTGTGIVISDPITVDGWGSIDVAGSRTLNLDDTITGNTGFTNSGIVNIRALANLTVNGTFTAYGTSEVHVSSTGSGGLFVIGGNLTWDSSSELDLQNDGILRFSGTTSGTFTRNVTDTAVISGTGTVEAESGFNLFIQGLLTVNTAFHNSGQIYLYQSTVMTVNGSYTGDGSAAVGVGINGYNSMFITTGPFSWNSTGHVNLNYGAVFRFGGTGTAIIFSSDLTVEGSGTVDVATNRTLNINGALTVLSGFSASGNAEIHISTAGTGGTLTLGGTTNFTSSKVIDVQTGGTLRFGGSSGAVFNGTATISGAGTTETESGFILYCDGDFTANTPFVLNGQVNLFSNRTATFNGDFTAGETSGLYVGYNGYNSVLNTNGNFTFNSVNEINLQYNSVFRFGGSSGSLNRNVAGTVTFQNSSTSFVEVTAGRTLYINSPVTINAPFNNYGLVQVNPGKILTLAEDYMIGL